MPIASSKPNAEVIVHVTCGEKPISTDIGTQPSRSNKLEFSHRRLSPLARIVPSGPTLKDHHVVTFHGILQPHLVTEMWRAPLAAQLTHGLLDPLQLDLTECHSPASSLA
jgi:hypothetical protein